MKDVHSKRREQVSLRTKTLLAAGAFFVVVTLAFLAVSYIVAQKVVAELEKEAVRLNMERALGALEREVATMDDFARDWAAWDDTYAFIEEENAEYISSNLVESTFEVLRLNYIMLINNSGQSVYARGYDPDAGEEIPVPAGMVVRVLQRQSALAIQEADAGTRGLVILPEGPVLVAAEPVHKSDGSGPSRGILIFGRLFTDKHLEELSQITRLPLSLHPPEAVDFRELRPAGLLENGEAYSSMPISPTENAGFATLIDIYGETALILQVNVTRQAARVFKAIKTLAIFWLVLVGVLSSALAAFWVKRTILSRLLQLTGEVTSTAGDPGRSQRLQGLKGNDELAMLSVEINSMLNRLERYQREIQEREKKYREVVENTAEAIVVVQDGTAKLVNPAAARLTDYQEAQLIATPIVELVHPEDRKDIVAHNRRLIGGGAAIGPFIFRIRAQNGDVRWVETNTVAVEWEGRPATLHFLTDVTARKLLEDELQRLATEKALILDNLLELVCYLDRDMHIIWANRAAGESVGKSSEALWGAKCYQVWHARSSPCEGCPVIRAMETGQVSAGEIASLEGRLWYTTASPVTDEQGNVIGAVETGLEITERKRYEDQLKYLSLHDQLTGLYNRAFFEEELRRLSAGREYPVTILVADLDGLKLVNDTMGHVTGDGMLQASADILRTSLRLSDMLARIGGDEFAALLPATDAKTAEAVVRRIRSCLDSYNSEHPELSPLHLSLGFATATSGEQLLDDTFRQADELMYRYKFMHRASARNQIVGALLTVLEEKDFITAGHAQRVEELCLKMGKKVGLSPRQMTDLALLARIHDLGKVIVPDSIIFKQGPLTAEELEVMRQHSERGYRIALSSPDLAGVADLILKHHERWDGSGYPLGLKGEKTPVECRILAISDAFDAMTSERPYKRHMRKEEAVAELKRYAGSQFDPQLVSIFVSIVDEY